jgi:hypothetical protein
MTYLYILGKNTSIGPLVEARLNLTLPAIQGIYTAQLLGFFIDYEEPYLNFPSTEFFIISKSPLPALPPDISYEEIYNYPISNLLDYLGRVQEIDDEAAYHSVNFDEYGNIKHMRDDDTFTHIIRYYRNSGELSNIGVKVTPSNIQEFIDGFLKYFKLFHQYRLSDLQRSLCSFEIQEYHTEIGPYSRTLGQHLNKYTKVGKPLFLSTINVWLFTALPMDIKNEIVQYLPRTFSMINKGYYKLCQPYVLAYCQTSIIKLSTEILRRINLDYPLERIMELYKPEVLNEWKYLRNIIRASLSNINPKLANRILDRIRLDQSVGTNIHSISNAITKDLTSIGYKEDTVNEVLKHIIGRQDYNPEISEIVSNLFFTKSRTIGRTILSSGKFDPNTFDLEITNPTNDAIELLIEFPGYNLDNFDYELIFLVIQRAMKGSMSIEVLQKALNHPRIDPSYNNNSILTALLQEMRRNPKDQNLRLVIDAILNNPRLDIYRGNFWVAESLAELFPSELLEILRRDGNINNSEIMNNYVLPYLRQ